MGGVLARRLLGLALCFLLAGGAFAKEKLEDIPMKWTPTDTIASLGAVDLNAAALAAKIHVDALVDARQNPAAVGENRENTNKVLPVTTTSDVAAFITDHLKDLLRGAGLDIADGAGDVELSGEIRQFFVTETSLYHGDMSVLVHLKSASGKELWSGVISSAPERFGRSYKSDNYYETMSDMIVRSVYSLLSNPGFREALQKR
jgi:hypothetical protein